MKDPHQNALNSLHRLEKRHGKKIIRIIGAANYHILMNFGDGMAAGSPMPVEMNEKRVWTVPIVLAPKCGGPAEIGSVVVDDETQDVIGATNKKLIMRNVGAVAREKAAPVDEP